MKTTTTTTKEDPFRRSNIWLVRSFRKRRWRKREGDIIKSTRWKVKPIPKLQIRSTSIHIQYAYCVSGLRNTQTNKENANLKKLPRMKLDSEKSSESKKSLPRRNENHISIKLFIVNTRHRRIGEHGLQRDERSRFSTCSFPPSQMQSLPQIWW